MRWVSVKKILRGKMWILEHFHFGDLHINLLVAGLIGLAGGLACLAFREGIHGLQGLMTGHTGSLVETARDLPWGLRLLVPAFGGLAAGAILHYGVRITRAQKTADYMEAVTLDDGALRFRHSLVKCASSLFSIASGGSLGREGPMVQLSAVAGALAGKARSIPPPRLKLFIACGAAAGIASAYNAPIAGALFMAEIVHGSIAMETLGPMLFASVVATLTTHQVLGFHTAYAIPSFALRTDWETPLFILVGLVCGGFAPLFIRLLNAAAAAFRKLHWPLPWTLGLGGLVVGLLSIREPAVWGNGYSVVNSILAGHWVWGALLVLLAFKLLATAATVGSGAVGGVFTPSLFVGAVLGYLVGDALQTLLPGLVSSPANYALVGMGCFLSATTLAPLMAVIMLFELTLTYEAVLPLMLGCVTAYFTAQSLGSTSIYAAHLRKKREESLRRQLSHNGTIAGILRADPPAVPPEARFRQVAEMFLGSTHRNLYVTDRNGIFLGAISLDTIKPFLNDPDFPPSVLASDIHDDRFPRLSRDSTLAQALEVFRTFPHERLPILNEDGSGKLVATLSKTDLMLALVDERPGEHPKIRTS